MHRMLVTGLFALVAALVPLPSPAHAAQRFAASYAETAQPIPFELFRNNRIFLAGRINGHPASILLDNGASSSVVSQSFAEHIGLTPGRAVQSAGAGGRAAGRFSEDVTISVGPLTLAGTTVVLLNLDEIGGGAGRPVDAILGMEAFRAGIVDIDFERRSIRFAADRDFTAPAGAVAVPITDDGKRRTIPVSINGGQPIAADVDLGHSGSLMVSRETWERDPVIAALPWAPATRVGIGGRVAKRMVTLPSVTVGGVRIEAVPGALNEGASDLPVSGANIGLHLLQRFRLVFRFSRNMLYMVPLDAGTAGPLPKDRLGMRLQFDGGRLRVAELVPNSPAAQAGWHMGDEVIAIDGITVGPAIFDNPVANWNVMPAGRRLDLVRADGTHLPVTLRDFF